MADWKQSITQVVGAERISKIQDYVAQEPHKECSPIDEYYQEIREVTSAFSAKCLSEKPWLGSILTVAIVSATENYFRNLLSRVLKVCSDSQKNASQQNINFGSVLWHPSNVIERGAFEHISFSGSDKIIDVTKKYIGLDLKQGSLSQVLEEFDIVCELRHGVVHSGRVLAGKNAIRLKLPSSDQVTRIEVRYGQLQEIAAVCATLVVAYNQLIFVEMCKRWATSWRRTPLWDKTAENKKFKALWDAFFSDIDRTHGTIPDSMTWIKCRNLVKKEFNIA